MMPLKEFLVQSRGELMTRKQLNSKLSSWYIENSYSMPAHLTIRDFFELAMEKSWIRENPDGTYVVS